MKKKYADYLIKLAFLTLALFLVFNFSFISHSFTRFICIVKPVLLGVLFYMILAVPYDFFSGKLFRKIKNEKLKKILAFSLTVLLFAGAVSLLGALTVPQSIESVKEITESFDESVWDRFEIDPFFTFLTEGLKKGYKFLSAKLTDYLPVVLDCLKELFTGLYNLLFGFFIGVLLLLGRDSVKRQFKNMARLLLPEEKCRVIFDFLKKTVSKFSRYLGGQMTEAFILGTACYVTMVLLRVPYPALIGLVIGFSNLIPIVGAYAGGILCGLFVFAVDPIKCLVYAIAVFCLQQLESFTTYPIIVGKYVGLSGFWIAVSVVVWGGLFGFWGLMLGVPLTAVLQDVFRAKSLQKNKKLL